MRTATGVPADAASVFDFSLTDWVASGGTPDGWRAAQQQRLAALRVSPHWHGGVSCFAFKCPNGKCPNGGSRP